MNRHTALAIATLLGLVVAAPQTGLAQSLPPVGTWKLNIAKSTFVGPPPRSQTVDVQAEGQVLRLTIENIDAQGNSAKAVIVDFNDGKFHPVTGVAAYDAQAEKVVTDSTKWTIRTKAGKVVQTLIGEMSADGKTWTTTIGGVTPNGQPVNVVFVREKQ